MIVLTFQFGNEFIKVKIDDYSISFADKTLNYVQFYPIECLKLNKQGILKEHPDLKDLPPQEMQREAIQRFKNHIRLLPNEEAIKKYIVSDLEKFGYKLKLEEKKGFRPRVIK